MVKTRSSRDTFGKSDKADSIFNFKSESDDLYKLLDGITDENIHAETDWGKDVGKEIVD